MLCDELALDEAPSLDRKGICTGGLVGVGLSRLGLGVSGFASFSSGRGVGDGPFCCCSGSILGEKVEDVLRSLILLASR